MNNFKSNVLRLSDLDLVVMDIVYPQLSDEQQEMFMNNMYTLLYDDFMEYFYKLVAMQHRV